MTENPSVPPPSGLQQQFPSNSTSLPTPDEAGDASGEIQCICEFTEDDGYTICCDGCGTWQHIACMQLREDDLPKKYLCSNCSPRPVDAKKARELQRQRRRDEKNNRRKRAALESKGRKSGNPTQNGTVITAHDKPGVVKLPSPREPQAPPARKRNRGSHSASVNAACAGATGTASPLPQMDRNGDAESDTDMEKYKIEFLDMGSDPNKYVDEAVKVYLSKEAVSNDHVFKRYSQHDFTSMSFPKASVQMLPDSSKSYTEHSRWCYVLEAAIPRGKPVALFKGEVGFQDVYKLEPINQYGIWHHPKPYVVFHPSLPIYIDARRWATEARFVRRSCKPNVCVKTLVVDDSTVYFGLVASEAIKAGTELTIGWDWSGLAQLQHLEESFDNLSKLSADEMKQAALWADNLLEKMGECACLGGADCLLAKIRKQGGIEPKTAKRPTTNGNGRKRAKRNPSAELTASKEATPDRGTTGNDDEDDAKQFAKVKSRSRDLTPALPHDIAVESGAMTSRDAKKFKEMLSRIEKQTQEMTSNKRQKRNSNVSLPPRGNSPSSDIPRREEARKSKTRKLESPATSPGSASAREVSVVDASTGRSPGSSNGNQENGRSRVSSNSPVISSSSTQARRKVKSTKSSKLQYVDSGCQTVPADDELPWWKQSVHHTPHCSPRTPLRKRLIQSLVRVREESVAASGQDKKRKHDAYAEDTSVSLQPPKQPKTDEAPKTPEISINRSISPHPNPSELGPSLGNLFADSSNNPHTDAEMMKPPPHLPSHATDKPPPVNGFRSSGLHLQLPPSNLPPNGVIAPGQSTPITGPVSTPLSGTSILSPGVMASVNASSFPISPGPTKTKKLSLQDYRKRSHKPVDVGQPEKKEEDSTMIKSANDTAAAKQLAFLNVLTPPENALSSTTSPQAVTDSKISTPTPWGVR